ncbi:MAG: FtsK/SpoIIIE domain-containing protein, partial [Acidimicrobiia bacterium]
LRSITAEIRHRERVLRSAGAESIDKYPRSALEVLPRLVVVVDEFAALSADLPEFIPALIDVAQRGRSLGIHLILATQRPAGVVGDAIRANTNLRVALRTQTGAESSDVIGEPVAAQLPRHRPGRGYARLGPGELIAFQAATGSLAIESGGSGGVSVAEVNFGWEPVEMNQGAPSQGSGASDLDALVSMVGMAAAEAGLANPRLPWADPLPDQVRLGDGPAPLRAVIGIADEPDRQRVVDLEWNLEDGGLLAFGMSGSGVSDALVAACFAQATMVDPGSLHIYGLDGGGGSLNAMTGWPHVGAVVGISDRERTLRLVRRLDDRLTARQSCRAHSPTILIVIDRVESALAALDGPADFAVREALIRVVGEGPQFGIVPLLSASRPAAIPAALAAGISHRFCFRLADPFEYSAVGISPKDVPDLGRGRGFDRSGRMIQVGVPTPEGLTRLASVEFAGPLAPSIEVLPSRVPISGLVPGSIVSGSGWSLPVGLGDSDLAPIGFQLHPGDHVLVAGPPRSGRTTTLASIGRLAAMSIPEVEILALSGRDSALEQSSGLFLETVGELMEAVRKSSGPTLVLVDDAERVADPALDGLFDHRDDLHVIAAGRADALRGLYQHWTRQVRRCRLGVSLQPEPELDGDLWQTRFPRHGPAIRQPGRGYLVSAGRVELVQVAAS